MGFHCLRAPHKLRSGRSKSVVRSNTFSRHKRVWPRAARNPCCRSLREDKYPPNLTKLIRSFTTVRPKITKMMLIKCADDLAQVPDAMVRYKQLLFLAKRLPALPQVLAVALWKQIYADACITFRSK